MNTQKLLAVGLIVASLCLPLASPVGAASPVPPWADGSRLFVENVGQFPPEVRFQVRGGTQTLWLTEQAMWLVYPDDEGRRIALRITYPDANPHPRLEPVHRLPVTFNFYLGDDPAKWRTRVPVWGGVRYVGLYPGFDLEIGGAKGRLMWRLVRRHPAAPLPPSPHVEGAEGLSWEDELLPTLTAPSAQENVADGLLYSTFLGGSDDDCPAGGCAIALDAAGHVYVTGETASGSFPTTPGAYDTSYPVLGDVFIAKLKPDGSGLVYATLLGGGRNEIGRAIAVDGAGNVYVTGTTESSNFPTTEGAFDRTYNEGYYPEDAFVTKLNADGTALLFSTYLGGTANDQGSAIALDDAGQVYVAGRTQSSNFPTTEGAFDPSYNPSTQNGENDAFVTKLNATGSALVYSTYLGGGCDEGSKAIFVDGAGYAYVTGNTCSTDFPTTEGAFDRQLSGTWDAFLVKLNAAGSALSYATYLGGSGDEAGKAIAVDAAGRPYVGGDTSSVDFPATVAHIGVRNTDALHDLFVTKFQADGTGLVYAVTLGGSGVDYMGNAMAVDDAGALYLPGGTASADFPTTAPTFDATFNGGGWDGVVLRLNAAGTALDYATFLGGNGVDFVYGLALGAGHTVYVAGHTSSGNFPTTDGAFDGGYNGGFDAFAAHLSTAFYNVGGRVLDGRGEPLSGVQISADGVYTATTDASGHYTFTLVAGTYHLAPLTAGFFWAPATRTVTLPPDAQGVDFIGRHIQKEGRPPFSQAMAYGHVITYTIRLLYPEGGSVTLYDRVPTYTTYVSGSLSGPAGVAYSAADDAISGTFTPTAGTPTTVTFAVRTAVTGTATLHHLIANRACVRPSGAGMAACEWSEEVWNATYVWPLYLPLVARQR